MMMAGGTSTWMLAGAALLGLVVGSFLNVVIHRLPRMLERRWAQEEKQHSNKKPRLPRASAAS